MGTLAKIRNAASALLSFVARYLKCSVPSSEPFHPSQCASKGHAPGIRTDQLLSLPLSAPTPPPSGSAALPPTAFVRAHGVLLNGPLEDLEERMFWEEVAVVKRVEGNGLDMVVKYGRKVSEVEAEVLKMVYGVARDGDETFIYQELIDGRTLRELWPRIDGSARESLLCDLLHHLDSLHALRPPSPATPLGALVAPSNERLSRLSRLDAELASDPIVCGSTAFRDWIALELKRRTRDAPAADIEKLIDALIPLEQAVGLVHGDVHGGNVIARDGRIVALIDFEYAAWAPPWVEQELVVLCDLTQSSSCCRDIAAAVCGSEAREMAWTPFVTFLQRSA